MLSVGTMLSGQAIESLRYVIALFFDTGCLVTVLSGPAVKRKSNAQRSFKTFLRGRTAEPSCRPKAPNSRIVGHTFINFLIADVGSLYEVVFPWRGRKLPPVNYYYR